MTIILHANTYYKNTNTNMKYTIKYEKIQKHQKHWFSFEVFIGILGEWCEKSNFDFAVFIPDQGLWSFIVSIKMEANAEAIKE